MAMEPHAMDNPAPRAEYVPPPTDAEIQRVREWECSRRGHYFDAVMVVGSLDPRSFICPNCGKTWDVRAHNDG